MKGSYVLFLKLAGKRMVHVGSLGDICFQPGCYAYVGSAMGGLEARVARHLRQEKKVRWHIDYLLQTATVTGVITCPNESRIECEIARILNERCGSVPGFGSSDCSCGSHLFYCEGDMIKEAAGLLTSAGFAPETMEMSHTVKLT